MIGLRFFYQRTETVLSTKYLVIEGRIPFAYVACLIITSSHIIDYYSLELSF